MVDEHDAHDEPAPSMVEPTLHPAGPGHRGVQVWSLPAGTLALSSAAVGGGPSRPRWVLNTGVARDYRRTDLAAHVDELAHQVGLGGDGIGLFTAAKVDRMRRAWCQGVVVEVTAGLSKPTWAADPGGGWNVIEGSPADDPASQDRSGLVAPEAPPRPGTINIVAQLPVALEPGAAVNAVITATEAKTQALLEAGIPGTGTASDAVVILWPERGPACSFAGPRSPWGARLALATREAVADTIAHR